MQIARCAACGKGWGSCKEKGVCRIKDDFQELHEQIRAADGLVIVTPVYWWDMSESARALLDRLRRCEAMQENNCVKGKPFIGIAAAGGTGAGTISCLAALEKMFLHLNNLQHLDLSRAVHDFIGLTQKNRLYMLEAVRAAAGKMTAAGQQ